MLNKAFAVIIVLCFSISANADYQVIGTMVGEYCTGFIIKSCGQRDLLYISRGDQLFELGQVYDDNLVSAQGTPNGRQRCRVFPYGHPRSATYVVKKRISNVNYVYRDENGELVKFRPDSVAFRCRRI